MLLVPIIEHYDSREEPDPEPDDDIDEFDQRGRDTDRAYAKEVDRQIGEAASNGDQ